MPEYKHKWLLECANAFGMKVKDFAEFMGYSRQAVYQANEGITKLEPRRLALAQFKLDAVNEKMLAEERAKADENFKRREKLIDELMERLGR